MKKYFFFALISANLYCGWFETYIADPIDKYVEQPWDRYVVRPLKNGLDNLIDTVSKKVDPTYSPEKRIALEKQIEKYDIFKQFSTFLVKKGYSPQKAYWLASFLFSLPINAFILYKYKDASQEEKFNLLWKLWAILPAGIGAGYAIDKIKKKLNNSSESVSKDYIAATER